MKIAVDFDGTVVDKKYNEYIDKESYMNFITKRKNIHIVTSRPVINKFFINKVTNIPLKQIICCSSIKEKIKYINRSNYDCLIDDSKEILQRCNVKFKFNINKYSWRQLDFLFNTKKMFSPGPVPASLNLKLDFSHRSEEFRTLYKNTKKNVLNELKIKDRKLLFTQGSGTSAIEATLSSLSNKQTILIYSNGVFGDRAVSIAKKYYSKIYRVTDKNALIKILITHKIDIIFYVQFETSKSKFNNIDKIINKHKQKNTVVVSDCVSALGFYSLPDVDVICSSSSKILHGLPAMGIVLYKKNIFSDAATFYFDINRYIESDRNNETPHTSLIPQIYSLNKNIKNRVIKQEIINNCKCIKTKNIHIINEKIAPVLTLKRDEKYLIKIFKWFKEFNIEPYYNKVYMKDYFQLGMFNYKDKNIYILINNIIEVVR